MKKRGHDFAMTALRIVEQAIGERMDGTPLEEHPKRPTAVSAGRIGGKKGGKSRAEKLSASERKAIAQKAARSRWGKKA